MTWAATWRAVSNFDFKWLWNDWLKVAYMPHHATQRRFVCNLLDRSVRACECLTRQPIKNAYQHLSIYQC